MYRQLISFHDLKIAYCETFVLPERNCLNLHFAILHCLSCDAPYSVYSNSETVIYNAVQYIMDLHSAASLPESVGLNPLYSRLE